MVKIGEITIVLHAFITASATVFYEIIYFHYINLTVKIKIQHTMIVFLVKNNNHVVNILGDKYNIIIIIITLLHSL